MMRTFTGKHMAATLIGGFGIVIAVNFYMASLATGGFGGVVVENSYVASQKYNEWLEEARQQEATGWEASVSRRDDGLVVVTTMGTPEDISVSAIARRPLGKREVRDLTFAKGWNGDFVSQEPLDADRWTLRVKLEHGGQKRIVEASIP